MAERPRLGHWLTARASSAKTTMDEAYALFGLTRQADDSQLDRAYVQKASAPSPPRCEWALTGLQAGRYHPTKGDRSLDRSVAASLFRQTTESYLLVKHDPQRRAREGAPLTLRAHTFNPRGHRSGSKDRGLTARMRRFTVSSTPSPTAPAPFPSSSSSASGRSPAAATTEADHLRLFDEAIATGLPPIPTTLSAATAALFSTSPQPSLSSSSSAAASEDENEERRRKVSFSAEVLGKEAVRQWRGDGASARSPPSGGTARSAASTGTARPAQSAGTARNRDASPVAWALCEPNLVPFSTLHLDDPVDLSPFVPNSPFPGPTPDVPRRRRRNSVSTTPTTPQLPRVPPAPPFRRRRSSTSTIDPPIPRPPLLSDSSSATIRPPVSQTHRSQDSPPFKTASSPSQTSLDGTQSSASSGSPRRRPLKSALKKSKIESLIASPPSPRPSPSSRRPHPDREGAIANLTTFLDLLDGNGSFNDGHMPSTLYDAGVATPESLLAMDEKEVEAFVGKLEKRRERGEEEGVLTPYQEATLARRIQMWKERR